MISLLSKEVEVEVEYGGLEIGGPMGYTLKPNRLFGFLGVIK